MTQANWAASPTDIRSPQPPAEADSTFGFALDNMAGANQKVHVAQISDWVEAKVSLLRILAEVHATDSLR